MAPATVPCALQPRHRQVVRTAGWPGGSSARDSRIYSRHGQDPAKRLPGRPAGLRGTSGDVRETSAEDCCAAVAHPPGSLQISYPRLRHVVRHGDWAVPRVSGTLSAVPRKTSAEDSRAAVAHPPGSLQISLATGILAVWHGLRGGCRARVFSRWRRGSIPPTGDRRGWAGAWRLTWMCAPPEVQRQPSSSRASAGAVTVAMIANRTVAKTAAANKMPTPFIESSLHPPAGVPALPCCRM